MELIRRTHSIRKNLSERTDFSVIFAYVEFAVIFMGLTKLSNGDILFSKELLFAESTVPFFGAASEVGNSFTCFKNELRNVFAFLAVFLMAERQS